MKEEDTMNSADKLQELQINDDGEEEDQGFSAWQNWRQLFHEDELALAYVQSCKEGQNDDDGDHEASKPALDRLLRKQAEELKNVSENEGSESDNSASDDNLHEVDLYSKVYLHKKDKI